MIHSYIFVERTLVSIYNKSNPGKKNWLTTIDLRNAICIHIKKKKKKKGKEEEEERKSCSKECAHDIQTDMKGLFYGVHEREVTEIL